MRVVGAPGLAAGVMAPTVEIAEIARDLNARVDGVVSKIGLAGQRQGHDFVAYNPTRADHNLGSFRVCIAGPKQGMWAEFAETGRDGRVVAGDALDLVAYCLFGGDKRPAIRWARQWLGLDPIPGGDLKRTRPTGEQLAARAEGTQAKAEGTTAAFAFRTWLGCQKNIDGTPADLYLRGRGIELARFTRASGKQRHIGPLRYHPALPNKESGKCWPALVAGISSPTGQIVAIHRTWLEVCRHKVQKAPLKDPKMTLGRYRGGAIRLWRGESGKAMNQAPEGDVVAIAEGIEDALTIALEDPTLRVLAAVAISNMGAILLPPGIGTVFLVADNDAPGSPAARALDAAARRFKAQGRAVKIVRPPEGAKDVNQVLQKGMADGRNGMG